MLALDKALELLCLSGTFFEKNNMVGTPNFHKKEDLLLLLTILNVCHVILHATIVPIFSRKPPLATMSQHLLHTSAEKVVHHAFILTSFVQRVVSTSLDLTIVSPIVAYAAFILGSVLVTLLTLHQSDYSIRQIQDNNQCLNACMHILETLQVY